MRQRFPAGRPLVGSGQQRLQALAPDQPAGDPGDGSFADGVDRDEMAVAHRRP